MIRYFADDKAKGTAYRDALYAPEHQTLRELAGSPLLLSLLCLNYERSDTFPTRLVDEHAGITATMLSLPAPADL